MSPASPTPVKVVAKVASTEVTTRSHASASAAPAPNAGPSTAATTGLGVCQMARITRWAACALGVVSWRGARRIVEMSPPEQNAPPAPVSTMARTRASESAASSASASA